MNKLLLDSKDIKLILERRKDHIGKHPISGIDSVLAAVGYLLTIYCSSFDDGFLGKIPNVKIYLYLIGIAYLIWGLFNIIRSLYYKFYKPYTHEDLYKELEKVNQMEKHPHSIVLIKDDFNRNPNRYLLYYDNRWNCKLFLNFHTVQGEDEDNIHNLENHVKAELKTTPSSCRFAFERIHSKYSVSAQKEKYYQHRFYRMTLKNQSRVKKDSFEIDGKTYYWMSIAEMEKDTEIMEKNSDIVKFVKENGY